MATPPVAVIEERVVPSPPSRVALKALSLGIAQVDEIDLTRQGDRARVHRLRMRIPQDALVSFMASAIAGGTVQGMSVRTLDAHRFTLEARAFGVPTRALLSLSAVSGRVHMGIEQASVGWFPVSGRFLRDQILSSSEPAVIQNGDVRAEGRNGLSFAPDYLFSHIVARLPIELAQRGLPPHLDVRLTDIALKGRVIRVVGGE